MARPKEFDENDVLGRAMDLFRRQGYAETSFTDLTSHLGVSRQSLYDTFGDKDALFDAAVRRYSQRALQLMRDCLKGERPVRDELRELFTLVIQNSCVASGGCLMANSMVERSHQDANVRALALEHARSAEHILTSRLEAARRSGEIGSDTSAAAIARSFFHFTLGLGLASRTLGGEDALRESAELALRLLD